MSFTSLPEFVQTNEIENWTENFSRARSCRVIRQLKGFIKYEQFSWAAIHLFRRRLCRANTTMSKCYMLQLIRFKSVHICARCVHTRRHIHTHTHIWIYLSLNALFIPFNFSNKHHAIIIPSQRQSMHSRQNERGECTTVDETNPADKKCINCAFTMDSIKIEHK